MRGEASNPFAVILEFAVSTRSGCLLGKEKSLTCFDHESHIYYQFPVRSEWSLTKAAALEFSVSVSLMEGPVVEALTPSTRCSQETAGTRPMIYSYVPR